MKNKPKIFIKTVLAIAVLSSIANPVLASGIGEWNWYSGQSVAASTDNNSTATTNTQLATSIVPAPSYTSDMQAAGCDEAVWNRMVADYNAKAQSNVNNLTKGLVTNQRGASKSSNLGSCFGAAASIINNATKAYNTIIGILNGGGGDSSQLFDYAKNWATNAACAQLNSAIATSSLGTTLNSGANTVNGGINTVLNTGTTVGGTSTPSVSSVLNGSGYQTSTTGNVSVSGTGIANATGASSAISDYNPFK